MKKRIFATILTTIMLFSIVSCTQQPKSETLRDTDKTTDTVFDSTTEISIVIGSHSSWPYNENWIFWKYLREAVGGQINLQVIPNTEIDTKVTLMMASPKEFPDLIHVIGKGIADRFAPSGALIAIDDHLDKMPNYTEFWDSVPEAEREELLLRRKSNDGKTYYPQVYGQERAMNVRCWMYRKDIFEKHGLTPPETMDELYDTAIKLKTLYPDSYPLSLRSGLSNISVIGPSWKPYFTSSAYYDFKNEKWNYGASEPTMREIVEFLIKLRDNGLVPPDFLTITSKSWEELVSTNRGFFMPEYQTRLDFFNIPNQKHNPEFFMDAMKPPKATGHNMVAKYNVDPTGYVICNTGDQTRINNAIKFIDWYYTDEAAELMSWGREGETFEIVDGKRRFITSEGDDSAPKMKYGAHTYGLYLRLIPEAADAVVSKEQAATTDLALKYTEENYNPALWLAFTDEEQRIIDDIGATINAYKDEMLSKFILGQVSLTKWDMFLSELENMGLEELLDTYESAYSRVSNSLAK